MQTFFLADGHFGSSIIKQREQFANLCRLWCCPFTQLC